MDITMLPSDISALKAALPTTHVVLDAIFGFSFQAPVRAPFNTVLNRIQVSGRPIVSVDIPSRWDVERGPDVDGHMVICPEVLEGMRGFRGRHFLGRRFMPRSLARKYGLNLPEYPSVQQIVELPLVQKEQSAGSQYP
ncbi:hypothetical protein EDC04DRAFT_2605296 [Pisolithus marmoratus]|nr:hypothetical protein EDC04DRAFT_2605296 [Pisolithus marmoratus]